MNLKTFSIRALLFTVLLAFIIALVNYLVPFFTSFQTFTWITLLFFYTHHSYRLHRDPCI